MTIHSKTEKFWNRVAAGYDKTEEKDAEVYHLLVEQTREFLNQTDLVLDVGCGTGLISNEIAPYVCEVDGIDIASKMIDRARKKATQAGLGNIAYWHTTLFDEEFSVETYDVVLCFYLFHLLESPEETIERIASLLKPGGLLIAVTPCMGERPLLNTFFSFFSRLGLMPQVNAFDANGLNALLENSNFEWVRFEKVATTSNQYFTVIQKVEK